MRLSVDAAPEVASAVATALREGRRLHLRYVNAADITTERDVDPIRLATDDERSYLLGWCLLVDGERLFRIDRVLEAHVLDEPSLAHNVSDQAHLFAPGPEGELVTLHLTSQARWVAETAPVDAVRNHDDGSFEVDLRIVQESWLRHLVLQVADDVLDVRPRRVAEEVATSARATLRAYGALAESGV